MPNSGGDSVKLGATGPDVFGVVPTRVQRVAGREGRH